MESKSYQRFRSKVEYIKQHLQIFDAAIKTMSTTLGSTTDKTQPMTKCLGLNDKTYDKLKHPVREKDRVISYSRSKSSEYTILELFAAFTHYLQDITSEMYQKSPLKIVGKVDTNVSLTYAEIIKLGSFDKIGELMVADIFRKFENERSTTKLIDKILSHTKVNILGTLKSEALMYLEMRHLIIHNKGKADTKFKNSYEKQIKLKVNDKLPTNFKTISAAIDTIQKFTKEMDIQLLKENLLEKNEIKTAGKRT